MKVLLSDAVFFTYKLKLKIFALRYYRNPSDSTILRKYIEKIDISNNENQTEEKLAAIPKDAFLPLADGENYKGLLVPSDVLEKIGPKVESAIGIKADRLIYTEWAIATNDPLKPTLIVAWPAGGNGDVQLSSHDSILKIPQQHAGIKADLEIEELFVWHMPSVLRKKTGNGAIKDQYFLHPPKEWLLPTTAEQFNLYENNMSSDSPLPKVPKFSAFTLLFSEDGLLLYLKHPYNINHDHHLPPFLRELKSCKWLNFAKSLKGLQGSVSLTSGDQLPTNTAEVSLIK